MIISTDYPSVITKNIILDRDQESNAYRYNNNTVEYAGDIDPKTAWSILESYNDSLLVDV